MDTPRDPVDYDNPESMTPYHRAALAHGHYEHEGEWYVSDETGDDCRVFNSAQDLCEALAIDPSSSPDDAEGLETPSP